MSAWAAATRIVVRELSVLLPSLNSATVVGVQHVQLSLRQPVRITFKLLLQRKDDVDEVDDILIAHEGLNDRFQVSLSRRIMKDVLLQVIVCALSQLAPSHALNVKRVPYNLTKYRKNSFIFSSQPPFCEQKSGNVNAHEYRRIILQCSCGMLFSINNSLL